MGADLLFDAMKRISAKGYEIVMTVHDEIVVQVPNNVSSIEEICSLMSEPPTWAKDFTLLKPDGYEAPKYYFKN